MMLEQITTMTDLLIKANENIPTVKIKGKNYVMVKDRVKAFRQCFPGWRIVTRIVEITDEHAVMSAVIQDPEDNIIATGHAREGRRDTAINGVSFLEVCETSAIGRALGLLGIGIDDSFGSADEVMNAQNARDHDTEKKWADTFISDNERRNLWELVQSKGKDYEWMLNMAGADDHNKITVSGYAKIVKALNDD